MISYNRRDLKEGWSFWVNIKFYEFSGGVVFRSTVLKVGPPTWNLHHVKSERDDWACRVSGEIEHCHLDFSIWYFCKPFYQKFRKDSEKNLNLASLFWILFVHIFFFINFFISSPNGRNGNEASVSLIQRSRSKIVLCIKFFCCNKILTQTDYNRDALMTMRSKMFQTIFQRIFRVKVTISEYEKYFTFLIQIY